VDGFIVKTLPPFVYRYHTIHSVKSFYIVQVAYDLSRKDVDEIYKVLKELPEDENGFMNPNILGSIYSRKNIAFISLNKKL